MSEIISVLNRNDVIHRQACVSSRSFNNDFEYKSKQSKWNLNKIPPWKMNLFLSCQRHFFIKLLVN